MIINSQLLENLTSNAEKYKYKVSDGGARSLLDTIPGSNTTFSGRLNYGFQRFLFGDNNGDTLVSVYKSSSNSKLLELGYYLQPRLATDSRPKDWVSYLMIQESSKLKADGFFGKDIVNEPAHAMETIYTRLFAVFLQTHSDYIFRRPKDQALRKRTGQYIVHELRFTVVPSMLWISIALVSMFIVLVLSTYLLLPGRALGQHVPTSIAATIPLIYACSAIDEMAKMRDMPTEEERDEFLARRGWRFTFGWFEGKDGEHHYGMQNVRAVRR